MFEELLQDHVVLVTGAARGLGRAIAKTFAVAGATVAVHYNSSEDEARLLIDDLQIDGTDANAYTADMTDEFEVATMIGRIVEDYEHIDILVNNVGPFADIPMSSLPESDWNWIIDGNLKSAYLGCRLAGMVMNQGRGGHIVNIAAASASNPGMSVYGLAKRGVMQLTEIMAVELAPGVRVNALAPGILSGEHLSEDIARTALEATPLGKLVSAEEVARAALLISTELFSSVTGQTLLMDGGRSLLRR